jgi:hypothetical protein
MGVEEILEDFNKLQNTCKEMSGRKVLVGVLGDNGSDVLKIAHAHEYGSPERNLPERSFIRASFDAEQDKLNEIVSSAVNKALSGAIDIDAAAESVGAQAAQLVQNFIDDNRVKPPTDLAKNPKKTQYTTLYETGTHIRDRIAYKVVDE